MKTLKTLLLLTTLGALISVGARAQQIGSNTTPGQTETFKLTLNSQLVVEKLW